MLELTCAGCPYRAEVRLSGRDLCRGCAHAAIERACGSSVAAERAADDASVLRWVRRGGDARTAMLPAQRRAAAIARLLASGRLRELTTAGIDAFGRPTRSRSFVLPVLAPTPA